MALITEDPTFALGATPTVMDHDPIHDVPMRPNRFDRDAVTMYIGAAAASFGITWVVYERLTPFSGDLGFVVVWWMLFVAFVAVVARQLFGTVAAKDHFVRVLVISTAAMALIPLGSIIWSVTARGYHGLSGTFLTKTLKSAGPNDPFSAGGVWHSIVGSLEVVGIAMLISVPLGIMTAVFLNEIGGKLARPVRMLTDAMSAVPSIVAGLFVAAVLIVPGYLEATGFTGALALSMLMLPTITRTSEVVLRLIPGGLREASLALGGTEWSTTQQIVLPTARTGLVTATVLGVARVVGETAPLIVTMVGGAQLFNSNPFSGQMDTLPLFVWAQKVKTTDDNGIVAQRMWSGAFVLLMLVLVLFIAARLISNRKPGSRKLLQFRRRQ